MNRKILTVAGILLLLLVVAVSAGTSSARETKMEFPRNAMAPAGPDAMDASVEMLGAQEIAIRKDAAVVGPAVATDASPMGVNATVGDVVTFQAHDFYMGTTYNQDFVVMADGEHGIILIEKEAYDAFDGEAYIFPDPVCGRDDYFITPDQLTYLLDEFDNNIYDTVTGVFGEPLPRGDEGQKVWTLIFNIRDDYYYECDQTSYIAGYFSASSSALNNKNIMHIDSLDWANRVGPDVPRPFLYEGTFAHEFEHLVHFDIDPDEPSWVDEGLADLAGFLSGYGHSEGHVAYYMVYHPFTPLTFWGGGLEDYGASYLFQLYLYEKFGGADFVSALVAEQANGIEGIEKTLAAFGYREDFNTIFDRWTVANYIDDTRKAGGKYGYDTLEVGSVDSWGYTIPYVLANFWWGPNDVAPWAYDTPYGPVMPYTAQYYPYTNEESAILFLDGEDFAGTPAYNGTYEWYSEFDAWAWRSISQTFDIPVTGATLEFATWFDIEEDWDYGYVEVHDLDTDEWYTLADDGGLTVSNVAFPQDNPNTPDDREPTAYEAAGRWNAFTGSSPAHDWTEVSMDLGMFAGHQIELYFTTWQDGAFTLQMMYVDDISIPEIGFFDDVEAGEGDWSSTGWVVTDGIVPNGFGVMSLDTKWVPLARYPEPAGNNAMPLHSAQAMPVDGDTQNGWLEVSATTEKSGRMKVAIVSNRADHLLSAGFVIGVDYP